MLFRAYMLKSFFYSLEKHFMHKIRKSVLLAGFLAFTWTRQKVMEQNGRLSLVVVIASFSLDFICSSRTTSVLRTVP